MKYITAFMLITSSIASANSEFEKNIILQNQVKEKKAELNKALQVNKRLKQQKQNLTKSLDVLDKILVAVKTDSTPDLSSPAIQLKETTILSNSFQNYSFIKKDTKNYQIVDMPDGRKALKITATKPGNVFFKKRFGIQDCKGKKLKLSINVKADKVSNPKKHYLGIKFMLYLTINGKKLYPGAKGGGGTFNWKTLTFSYDVPFNVPDTALLHLGLQGVTGTVYYRDLKITAIEE